MKLDALDRKILFELDVNSRQSLQQIAKKVRSSKEVVAYRIKRLQENDVIFSFLTVIDPAKLGYSLHKIMFKLENIDENEKKQMVAELRNHPYSLWTVECDGPFDIGFMIFSRSLAELNEILTEIYNKHNKYINQRIISTNIAGEYFSRKYLIKKFKTKKPSRYGEAIKKIEIDKFDWQILFQLSKNARMSMTKIAKKVPLKIDAIRVRIKKMEKQGVISSYSVLLNNDKINQLHYKLLIYLKDLSKQKLKSIREFCDQHPQITYLIKSLGVWDLEIDLEVESSEQYREIMLLLMKQFPNTIRKYDSLQIYKLYQYRYLPDLKIILKV